MEADTSSLSIDELRISVRTIAQREIPAFQTEQWYGSFPEPLFRDIFADAGLTGGAISNEYSGLGLTSAHCIAIMEELAAVDLGPAIFLSVHYMVSGLIERFGTPDQKARLLPRLASGELLGAFALTEPSAGSDASNLTTSFTKHGSDYILNGEKCYITSAGWADIYVVFAREAGTKGSEGISALIVEKSSSKELNIGKPEKKLGCELSPIASLNFDNLAVPRSNLLGEERRGYSVALSGLAGGRINIAACANGLSRTAIRLALDHLCERSQFGQKLIEFQGLQFMLADMQIKYEAAKALTERAAQALANCKLDRSAQRMQPSIAKCFATDAAMSITTDAVQLLGGAGYIKEYGVERLMRDAKMLQIVEGTNQIQRSLIARELKIPQ